MMHPPISPEVAVILPSKSTEFASSLPSSYTTKDVFSFSSLMDILPPLMVNELASTLPRSSTLKYVVDIFSKQKYR